jgi:hypothetical protein
LKLEQADAVQELTVDGHVQSFTQHVVPAPHDSGLLAHDPSATDEVEHRTSSPATASAAAAETRRARPP